MAFWGVEVKAGTPAAYVPPPEQGRLRLSQATLSIDAPQGEKAALKCKVGNDEVLICSLREGGQESTNLDLILDSYTEFSLVSKSGSANASIHLAGYLIAEGEEEDEDDEEYDEEDAEDEMQQQLQHLTPKQLQAFAGQMQGDLEDSDSEDDDEESDTDEDEDDDDEAPNSTVIIEDITEQEAEKASAHGNTTTKVKEVVTTKKEKGKPATKALRRESKTMAPAAEEVEDMDDDSHDSEVEDDLEEKMEVQIVEAPVAKGDKRKAEAEAKQAKPKAAQPAEAKGKKKAKVESTAVAAAAPEPKEKPMKGKKTYPNGFIVENVTMGDPAGKLAKAGKKVLVKYVGKLQKTGKIFDQSKGNKPFAFRLGVNEVIKGWDQGVVGMRVGDKRKLTIPPQMAYGAKGIPNVIPGNSTLLFDVELVDVK